MQKLLEKPKNAVEQKRSTKKEETFEALKIEDILEFYKKKDTKTTLIGLEYERLSLYKDSFSTAKYSDIEKILLDFSKKMNWQPIYDGNTIIQVSSPNGSSISLEPGCQLEISLEPLNRILDIDINISKIIQLLDKIANIYDIKFLPYGVNPFDNCDEIELLNKERYKIMYGYLPYAPKGELAQKMMKKTAGIQVNIDYKDELDAYYKLKFLNMISPFCSALFANSPLENNRLTGNKSNRCNIWRYTGEQRCNFFYKDIFKGIFEFNNSKNLFKNYVKEVLKVPMIYIEKEGKIIPIRGKINFEQYMKDGFENYRADLKDYILHQSLCFPDVRLKQYIEIRNHDSSSKEIALALCAFYKGLMAEDIKKLIKRFSYIKLEDIEFYSKQTIKEGLNCSVKKGLTGWNVISELLNISKSNLDTKDRSYLKPIVQMIRYKKTQADIIYDYDIRTAKDLVEFIEK